jgi:hypothetical protein
MIVGLTDPLLGLREKLGFFRIKGLHFKVAVGFLVVLAPEVLLDFDHGFIHSFAHFFFVLTAALLSMNIPISL